MYEIKVNMPLILRCGELQRATYPVTGMAPSILAQKQSRDHNSPNLQPLVFLLAPLEKAKSATAYYGVGGGKDILTPLKGL